MTRRVFAACILSLAFVHVGSAQGTVSPAETGSHSTQTHLKQLARGAHTQEQYMALANYYKTQQRIYLQRAEDEKKEWKRRDQNIMGVFAKYPRPVDSARNLYEYYTYRASGAGALESKYSRLAAPAVPVNVQ
jgi:hypothetical protein